MRTLNRFVQVRSVWLAILLCLGLAIPANAVTIFSEGYEYADMTALQANGWGLNCSGVDVIGNPSPGQCTTDLVSSPVHGGSKALRQIYGANAYDANGLLIESFNSKITKSFSGVPDLYERYFVRYQCIGPPLCGFTQPSALQNGGAKQHYFNPGGPPAFFSIAGHSGNQTFGLQNVSNVSHTCPNGRIDISCNLDPNIATVTLTFGTWYCVETHLGRGIAEQWVNGILTTQYSGLVAPAAYNIIQVYRQAGDNMYRYEDDFVVSTTRVGCSGSPSADGTPPISPTGLTVR
jgi:hypothetical protein